MAAGQGAVGERPPKVDASIGGLQNSRCDTPRHADLGGQCHVQIKINPKPPITAGGIMFAYPPISIEKSESGRGTDNSAQSRYRYVRNDRV